MGSTRKGEGLPAKTKDGSVCTIFNHADRFDHLLMLVGFLGSVGDGLSTPLMFFISSRIMNNVGHRPTTEPSLFRHAINENAVFLLYLACGSWVASFLEGYCWTRTGERQAARLKAKYLRAVLRKDESYFDLQECTSSEVVVAVSNDSFIIQDTLSEKVPNLIMNIATFVGCYAVSFLMQWKLAVAASPFVILLIIPGHVCGRILMNLAKKNKNEYKKAGAIAEQAISSIRTVYSFAGEAKTISDFSTALQGSITIGLKQGLAKGLAIGSYNISYAIWSFIAWYGSRLIMYHGAQGGNVYNAGTSIAVGGLCLGAGLVNVKYLTEAIAAYERISDVTKSKPTIDSDDMAGKILPHIAGEVEFKDVKFAYPSRSNNMILNNFCLQIPSGKTMALVGPSGSGKSTVIALLERLYDPIAGGILLDGVDIRRLQLKWLRSQMALVSQEPVLFATTIKENILFGKESATMEEIISAAKVANAHNFVSQLPLGYDTQVGERGIQMSGGQKQRIAIARAVIRAPKILLLDEATSALDMESERIVQEALHMVSTGRTTLTVTHRLSSVHNAHTIAVITDGLVLESGPHGELIHKQDGLYSSMVKLQQTPMTMSSMLGEESPEIVERSDCFQPKWVESKNEDEGENHEELSDREAAPSFWRLLFMNLPEWRHACIGCMSAVLVGAVQPVYAYAMGSVISVYFLHDHDEMKEKIRAYCLFFFFVAVVSVAFNMIQHYNFAAMGEYLTKRVRERVLSKILTFEVGWFDREENSTGAICSRIAKDANIVRSLVGDRMALLVQTFSAIVLSCTMGLIIAWRLALVMISVQPILIICFYARKVLLQRMSKKATKAQDESTKLAGEAVSNHRTVAAFCSQARVLDIFQRAQDGPRRLGIRQSWVAGVVLGASKSLIACTWALDFWYGGKLISDGSITSKALFQTFMILISTGRVIADAGSMTSDLAKGSDAVAAVFKVLDRCTQIEPDDPKAHVPRKLVGHVELKDVEFAYPARPHVIIFLGLSLDIEAGKSTGLVGPSGSGKSTVIGLVERFYDPQKGTVTIDGCDIRSYHLRSLRKQIGLVGQEPALFAGTIRENIIYGFEGQVSETEIMGAARAANAHEFISCLQEGYDTWSGDSGVQLSGGQKQRIAIARALLKNPAVLLLDEPTSALDSQSEKLVQGALESAMVGRTVLVVAHRLSTIQNCHAIAVLKDGAIVEKGTHTTLMARGRNGSYYSLVASQNTDVQVHQSN